MEGHCSLTGTSLLAENRNSPHGSIRLPICQHCGDRFLPHCWQFICIATALFRTSVFSSFTLQILTRTECYVHICHIAGLLAIWQIMDEHSAPPRFLVEQFG